MAGLEPQIAETLSRAELVIQSNVDETVRLYYRRYRGTLVGDKYLCVVAKAVMSDAFVLTAYLTDKPRRGITLWPPEP